MHEGCYVNAVTNSKTCGTEHGADPTLRSGLRPLRELFASMDADIASLHAERGVAGVRPRFSTAIVRLHHRGPMTVRQLSEQVDVTHSAMSQTVTEMRREGLVASTPGADARTRVVELTEPGRALVPFLEAEWRATEDTWADLEREVPYPLSRVVEDLRAALGSRSFLQRLRERVPEREADDDAGEGQQRS